MPVQANYSVNELLLLRRYDVAPPRPVRKVIFSLGLWTPRFERLQHRAVGLPWRLEGDSREIGVRPLLPAPPTGAVKHDSPIDVETRDPTRRRLAAARRWAAKQTKPVQTAAVPTSVPVRCSSAAPTPAPSLYLVNAAALPKLHAIEHLAADLTSYNVDVAVITETHFKAKHSDSVVGVDGCIVFRRDRMRRRGGGVALYVRSTIQSTVWQYSANDRTYELHWVRLGSYAIVGSLYHPPKTKYKPAALLSYMKGVWRS